MIQEMPAFEAWQHRADLKIFVTLAPKTPCRIYKLPEQSMPNDTAIFQIETKNGQSVFRSGWESIYARPLNFLEKIWRKLK